MVSHPVEMFGAGICTCASEYARAAARLAHARYHVNKHVSKTNASLHLNGLGVTASGDDTAIGTFDDDLCERNAAAKFDHSAFALNLLANFCGGNVANTHFERHASLERIGPNNCNCADDVYYCRYATAVKGAIATFQELQSKRMRQGWKDEQLTRWPS